MKYIWIIITLVVILANLIKPIQIGKEYKFKTMDNTFLYEVVPSKGGEVSTMEYSFDVYKENRQLNDEDLILYRTFTVKWWQFWKWGEFLFDRNHFYTYPYLDVGH